MTVTIERNLTNIKIGEIIACLNSNLEFLYWVPTPEIHVAILVQGPPARIQTVIDGTVKGKVKNYQHCVC